MFFLVEEPEATQVPWMLALYP